MIPFEGNQYYGCKFQTSKHIQTYGLMSGGMLKVHHNNYLDFLWIKGGYVVKR